MIRRTGKKLEAILNKSVQIKWNQAECDIRNSKLTKVTGKMFLKQYTDAVEPS